MTNYLLIALVALAYGVIVYQLRSAREERRELEDRLMALTQPVALIQHKALSDNVPGDVSYVDEAKEWELSPSRVD